MYMKKIYGFFVFICISLLVACGGGIDEKEIKKVLDIYKLNVNRYLPNGNWEFLHIAYEKLKPSKSKYIVIHARIPKGKQADIFYSLSTIDQVHIAKLGCPKVEEPIWKELANLKDIEVWVDITGAEGGEAKSRCTRY